MKLSINLVFVLSFAFGVILVARRWIKPGHTSDSKGRAVGDSLSIRETLKLDNRISSAWSNGDRIDFWLLAIRTEFNRSTR